MFGVLNCHKPIGVTSRDVVNVVQRRVRPVKVGHAGTLDPLASGVLLLPVGPAVRLTTYLQELPKRYDAVFQLGAETASGDLEDEPLPLADAPIPNAAQVESAAKQLIGRIEQVPPAHSAIKVGGQRAYKLVRRGETVEMPARTVDIYGIEVAEYEYPRLRLKIECGSGTYVRTIGIDLAKLCDTVAVMTSLVRTAIGDFSLDTAHSLDALRTEPLEPMVCSPLLAVPNLPHVTVTDEVMQRIQHGQIVALPEEALASVAPDAPQIAAVDSEQHFRALLVPRDGGWRAHRCFPSP